MIGLLFDEDEMVARFVGTILGQHFVPPFTTIGVTRDGMLAGGVVFTTYTGPDVELSLAGPGCFQRGVIHAIAHYVFVQLKCVRLSLTVRGKDVRTQTLARKLGFEFEGYKRRQFGTDDGMIFGMLASECRWLET